MSMTKRYLESLPKEQQDDILGLPADWDEWYEDAENEPAEEKWPEEPGDEQCLSIFQQVEQARLEKPVGPRVRLNNNGVMWDV